MIKERPYSFGVLYGLSCIFFAGCIFRTDFPSLQTYIL